MFQIVELLTHWGRVAHICVSKLTIMVSDKGLSLVRRPAIICTNGGIWLIGSLETKFQINLNRNSHNFIKEMHLKIWSGNWWPFCFGINLFWLDFGGLYRTAILTIIAPGDSRAIYKLLGEKCEEAGVRLEPDGAYSSGHDYSETL